MRHPLILLPGTLCDDRLWSAQLSGLSAIAQPQVVDIGFADNMTTLATRILESLPSRFALAGFSFGGILAFELWRQAPQRITHLALIDTNARPDGQANQRDAQRQLARSMGVGPYVRDHLLPGYLYPGQKNPLIEYTIVAMAQACGLAVFERQTRAVQHRKDSRDDLHSISVPTLVTAGAEDQLCPPALQWEMADQIPDARCELLPQCGHFSPLEKPERINPLLAALLTH